MTKLSQSWFNLDHAALHLAPLIWQDWLSNSQSLTQLIEKRTKKSVTIKVLADQRQSISLDEQRFFQRPLKRCRVREVYLCIDDTPVVLARSILPTTSCTGINRPIVNIGNTPLGEVLFKKGKAPILARQITEIPSLGFGRRSLYLLRGHPILISEIFLPELLNKLH